MSSADEAMEAIDDVVDLRRLAPRVREWFWRPWYARLWWFLAALVWLLATVASIFFPEAINRMGDMAFLPMVLFHPFLIVPVLGFGFLRAWINHFGEGGDEDGGDDVIVDDQVLSMWRRRPGASFPRSPGDPTNPQSQAWLNAHPRPRGHRRL